VLKYEIAETDKFETICKIYDDCKKSLLEKNIFQWGNWSNNYPNNNYLKESIIKKELHILSDENDIIGSAILNENQSKEWNIINWIDKSNKFLIIHALVICPDYQNMGYGKIFLSYCEQFALQNNFNSMRLDSFSKNLISNNLYTNSGYINQGTVIFNMNPDGNKEYYCYEKLLKNS
jgi:GNAT superfamily N-acetyltransferase